ncbi:MAG: ABC transporter ATP-binding protein [Alphaproteobacteria bacterium]|nr:ABC transporter ATP-binding protein [Alphaproteobacteria bacterium]
MSGGAAPLLALRGVHKRYDGADEDVLAGVDLALAPGDRIAVVGPSGSGKSTLLFLLGLLDQPTAGTVEVDGRDVAGLDDAARSALRREHVGLVFQDHHLLPQATALDNVLLPWLADGRPGPAQVERARALLARLGLADRADHRPDELSTGQRQRVAVARALARSPRVVLADEPTGALDRARAHDLVELLLDAPGEAAVVVVTHDLEVARRVGRVLVLRDGRLEPS